MSGKCTKCGSDKCGLSFCKICEVKPEKEKKVHRIKPMSKKKQKANKEKMKVYAQIGEQNFCWSCGRTDKPLSRSHILPVGMYPQFESVEENIVIDCYGDSESCHHRWEHGTWEEKKKLNNFDHRVEVILKLAPSYLEQITPIKQTV